MLAACVQKRIHPATSAYKSVSPTNAGHSCRFDILARVAHRDAGLVLHHLSNSHAPRLGRCPDHRRPVFEYVPSRPAIFDVIGAAVQHTADHQLGGTPVMQVLPRDRVPTGRRMWSHNLGPGNDALLVHVETAAARVDNIHGSFLHPRMRPRWSAKKTQNSPTCSSPNRGDDTHTPWSRSQVASRTD